MSKANRLCWQAASNVQVCSVCPRQLEQEKGVCGGGSGGRQSYMCWSGVPVDGFKSTASLGHAIALIYRLRGQSSDFTSPFFSLVTYREAIDIDITSLPKSGLRRCGGLVVPSHENIATQPLRINNKPTTTACHAISTAPKQTVLVCHDIPTIELRSSYDRESRHHDRATTSHGRIMTFPRQRTMTRLTTPSHNIPTIPR